MRLRILRGTKEIGGSCVELQAGSGERLLLDLGLPLGSDPGLPSVPLVPGLLDGSPGLLAVIISHGHLDHWGLVVHARRGLPIIAGGATQRILAAAGNFVPGPIPLFAASPVLQDRVAFSLGPFRITPYVVDHSAFDAYALLVEADGKRVFYSGDLRLHGRKGGLVHRLMRDAPAAIDALILEGSSVGRPAGGSCPSEAEIEDALVAEFGGTPGLSLVFASSQNIDRIVSVYRAAKRTGRSLLIDVYTAEVLRATGRSTIPQATWPGIRVFVPEWQRRLIARKKLLELVARYRASRVYPEELKRAAPKSVLLFRGSMRPDLEHADALAGARLVWSMWEGYKTDPKFAPVLAWTTRNNIPITSIHTSGHAPTADLQRLIEALKPARVIPIHTAHPDLYAASLPRVRRLHDGELLDLAGGALVA